MTPPSVLRRWNLTSELYRMKIQYKLSKDIWKPIFDRYCEWSQSISELTKLVNEVRFKVGEIPLSMVM